MSEELISAQRNILMDLLGSCMELGKNANVDVWKLHIDAAIYRLDQAYKEAGWREPWDGATRIELNPGRTYLLNQEFYDRFDAAFKGTLNFGSLPSGIVAEIQEAAKKAAGIE